jgi:hypothetical protein
MVVSRSLAIIPGTLIKRCSMLKENFRKFRQYRRCLFHRATQRGNVVIASDGGTDIVYTIINSTGGTVVASTGIGESGTDVLNADVAGGLSNGRFVIAIRAS